MFSKADLRQSCKSHLCGNISKIYSFCFRALFNALKHRYQETAERSTNDPGVRAPFSTWRRSGNYEDVTSSKGHDDGKSRVESISETSDSFKRDSYREETAGVKNQIEDMSLSMKEHSEQNPDDLIYNFRKALHRHRISENEKADSNKLSGDASDSAQGTEDESVNEKLQRLRAAKARIEDRKRAEQVKSASFVTEFKEDSNKLENEENERKEKKEKSETKTKEQQTIKSSKLSRQKLVSDDLRAKYIENKKEEREKTPNKSLSETSDSVSKKRSTRRGKHKEHMEYWSKDKDETDDSIPKPGTSVVPTPEEMLLGSTRLSERSPSLRKKPVVKDTSFQFCADYSSKPVHDSLSSSVSPSLARKQERVSMPLPIDTVTDKTQHKSETSEKPKGEKPRRYKKYTKAKSHELGALSSEPKPEVAKAESKDDTAVGSGIDEMSRLERIAKYKEERRRQLASISSKFSGGDSKELPSLFLAGSESPLSRSKSMKTESEINFLGSPTPVNRSKSLKQDRHSEFMETDDSAPVIVTKMSGLKLAEIGSGNQGSETIDATDKQYNTDKIIDKLQALKKLREEHLKKPGISVEELKSKRASREEQELDKMSRGSSVESGFGAPKTLLADKVFEAKDRQDRTPSRDRIRSNSREKTSELRHSYTVRDSIPESESDRTTDVSDADSDIYVKARPRKFFQDKQAKDTENTNKSLFEFSTVYAKKDDSIKVKKDSVKDIKTIPEITEEKSVDSGRESVDSLSRVRRKLPSIEDVLGSKTSDSDKYDTSETLSADQRSVSDSSESHYEFLKDDISQLSASEIERRKIANNIQKAKSRFMSDESDFDPSKFELGTTYSTKSSDAVKNKTSSLDRNVKLYTFDQKGKTENLMPVSETETNITAKGLDLAEPKKVQTDPEKVKERKYGGGGFELGMSYTPKKVEELIKTDMAKDDEVFSEEKFPSKQKKGTKKYGGGGLDLGTSFIPRPIEVKTNKTEIKTIENEEKKHDDAAINRKQFETSDKVKESQSDRKYGGETFDLGTSFIPKKSKEVSVKEESTMKDKVLDSPANIPQQAKEERKYGGGGLDLGTSFNVKKPEKPAQLVQTRRASDELKNLRNLPAQLPDTKVSAYSIKPVHTEEQPVVTENIETNASKPPSSPRSDRRKLAEQRFGQVSSTAQPLEFSSVYVKKDEGAIKNETSPKKDITKTNQTIEVSSVKHRENAEMTSIKPYQNLDDIPKQTTRPLSFSSIDTRNKTSERRSSLEREQSDKVTNESVSNTTKLEKLDLKAQAVSTATGKVIEHPLSPRRQSPVRSEPFTSFISETKVAEAPFGLMKKNLEDEKKETSDDKYAKSKLAKQTVTSSKALSVGQAVELDRSKTEKLVSEKMPIVDKDIKSSIQSQKPKEIKVDSKISENVPPTVSVKKEDKDVIPDKSAPKYVDLSNIELKTPSQVEQEEKVNTELEIPLFLAQKGSKVSAVESKKDEKAPDRGRKAEKVRTGKGKVEKTVIANVRNATILQDSTLDDILNRNVEYLSDMEPPDFSGRSQGSEKKGRPQSIHEHQKTKRAFKKRAAMKRSKSEDRSQHKVRAG